MKKTTQLLTLLVCFALGSTAVHAALSYWDSNDTTTGAGATPNGTWGTDNFWSTDLNGDASTTAWTSGNVAVFAAGTDAVNPFTVTVSGNQTVGGLTFESSEGPVTLSGGTLTLGLVAVPIIGNTNSTINSVLDGGGFTKTGTGTLTLNGANTYTNLTTVSAGVVVVGNANALGTTAANTTIGSGAAAHISGGINLAEPLSITSPGVGVGSTGAFRSLSGSNAVDFIVITGAAGSSARINIDAGTLYVRRIDAPNRTAVTFGGDGNTIISPSAAVFNVDGLFWGGEGGGVTKEGTGTLTLNGNATIRGTFRVSAGKAIMGAAGRFGNPGPVHPDLAVDGIFDMNGFDNAVDGLYGTGSVINAGTSTLVICTNASVAGTHTNAPNFSGVISGGTTLRKEGATRTQTLSGVNTYTGNTIIKAGTLLVNGSLAAASVVTVETGATLGGTGTIGGAVTVNAGGALSPGASIGTLTLSSDLTLSGNLLIEVNGSGSPSNDVISVAGTLTNAGVGTVTVTNIGWMALWPGYSYKIFNKPLSNALAMTVVSAGGVVWTNKLDVDGSIAVLSAPAPVPATNLTIQAVSSTNQTFSLTNFLAGLGAANSVYGILTSTNVTTPMANWWLIGITNSDAGGLIRFVDRLATNEQRFYRFGQ